MQSSFKKILKNPPVGGQSSYEPGQKEPGEKLPQEAVNLNDHSFVPGAPASEVAYWSAALRQKEAKKSYAKEEPAPGGGHFKEEQPQEDLINQEKERAAALKREESVEKGFQEGLAEGRQKAEEECQARQKKTELSLREAELCLREAKQKAKELIAASEYKIIELAMAVAEKLVKTKLNVDPDTITAIVRDTMNMLSGEEQAQLYVNPADYEACSNFSAVLKEEFKEINRLEIFADETMPRGSCRVESENGVAEYLLEEEKEQLKETLLKLARTEKERTLAEEDARYGKH